MNIYYNLGVSGQINVFIWPEGSQDWVLAHAEPRSQCDVYAACGPFTICDDDALPHCTCMKGFTVTYIEDWELDDRSNGCSRNTALDCNFSNESSDKFLSIPCVSLHKVSAKQRMLKAVVNVLKSAWAIALALHIPSVTIHALFGMKNC